MSHGTPRRQRLNSSQLTRASSPPCRRPRTSSRRLHVRRGPRGEDGEARLVVLARRQAALELLRHAPAATEAAGEEAGHGSRKNSLSIARSSQAGARGAPRRRTARRRTRRSPRPRRRGRSPARRCRARCSRRARRPGAPCRCRAPTTARIPGILHAATATPAPEPQTMIARSASPARDRLAGRPRGVRVVDGLGRVRAQVDRLVAERRQRLQHQPLEREARMVERARDPHRCRSPSRAPIPGPRSAPRPSTPARGPWRASRICVFVPTPGQHVLERGRLAPGSSRRSPAVDTPPPITISSGS